MNSNLLPLLVFVVVILLIPVSLMIVRRTPLGASLTGAAAAGLMRQIGVLVLSPTQRLMVVEVGEGASRRWLVLGITPNSIDVLHTMDPLPGESAETSAPPSPDQAGNTPFEDFLGKLRQTKGGGNVH